MAVSVAELEQLQEQLHSPESRSKRDGPLTNNFVEEVSKGFNPLSNNEALSDLEHCGWILLLPFLQRFLVFNEVLDGASPIHVVACTGSAVDELKVSYILNSSSIRNRDLPPKENRGWGM